MRTFVDRENQKILSTATTEWKDNEEINVAAAFKNQESRVEAEWSTFMKDLQADFQKQVRVRVGVRLRVRVRVRIAKVLFSLFMC